MKSILVFVAVVISFSICSLGIAQSNESSPLQVWKCSRLLDKQTRMELAKREKYVNTLFQLPSEYKVGSEEIKRQFITQWLNDLQSDNLQKIMEAAAYLGFARARDAAEPIGKLLMDGKYTGRLLWVCTRSIGQTGDKNSVPGLIGLLHQRQKDACYYARVSLAEITGVYYGDDEEKWKAWHVRSMAANGMAQGKKVSDNSSSAVSRLPSIEIHWQKLC